MVAMVTEIHLFLLLQSERRRRWFECGVKCNLSFISRVCSLLACGQVQFGWRSVSGEKRRCEASVQRIDSFTGRMKVWLHVRVKLNRKQNHTVTFRGQIAADSRSVNYSPTETRREETNVT